MRDSPASLARPIRPTRRSVSGILMFRGEGQVAYESTLERDFLLRQEFFTSVAEVVSQPVTIRYVDAGGRRRPYTPDFLVTHHLGDRAYASYPVPQLIEVKPRDQWTSHWREWSLKWKAAMRYARSHGWVFHVHDESRIRDTALNNILFLRRFRRMEFAEMESRQVLETIRALGSVTRDALLMRHFRGHRKAEGIAHIWHLLATRRLECDIHQPLTALTELWSIADD